MYNSRSDRILGHFWFVNLKISSINLNQSEIPS